MIDHDGHVKLLGSALVANNGLCISGDLGIDKDIDVVSAMFSVVSRFVEDTFSRPADQIKLDGDLFITKVEGDNAVLWMTSTGTSQELLEGAKNMMVTIESEFGDYLKNWDGSENKEIIFAHEHNMKALGFQLESSAKDSIIEVPEMGFDILKLDNVEHYIDQIEDAYDVYHMMGELDKAYELAKEAAEKLNKKGHDHSLFLALMASALVQKRMPVEETTEVLNEVWELSVERNNRLAQVECADAYATMFMYAWKNDTAREWNIKCMDIFEKHVKEEGNSIRNKLRRIKYGFTDAMIYYYQERPLEAIDGMKELLDGMVHLRKEERKNELVRFTLTKRRIAMNNNIGFTFTRLEPLDPEAYRKAIPYYEEAIVHIENSNNRWFSPIVRNNLSMSLAFIGDFERSMEELMKARKIALEIDDGFRIGLTERGFGIYYLNYGMKEDKVSYLYDAMHWFHKALDHPNSPDEVDYIETFMNKCEEEIKNRI